MITKVTQSTYRRPQSAQQAVLDELRTWLISGRLKPGDQVPQEFVAAELQTSVVPVREALKTLETEGQIIHIPHRGFFVARLSRDELLELCEIRSALETMAVDRCLALLTDDDVAHMRSLLTAMATAEKKGDIVSLVRLDREFHFVAFSAAGASQLTRIISTMWDHSDPYRAAFFGDEEHRRCSHLEHEKMVGAVAEKDRDRLIELLDAHRLSPLNRLGEILEPS